MCVEGGLAEIFLIAGASIETVRRRGGGATKGTENSRALSENDRVIETGGGEGPAKYAGEDGVCTLAVEERSDRDW
jgi:hypothetical protein